MQFAKSSEWPENIREQDVIFNEPPYYPRPRIKRDISQVTITVRHLPPNSQVTLQVRVLNKYYAGPPSEQIEFTTLEGREWWLHKFKYLYLKIALESDSYIHLHSRIRIWDGKGVGRSYILICIEYSLSFELIGFATLEGREWLIQALYYHTLKRKESNIEL